MPDLILQPTHVTIRADGTTYQPLVHGREREDGTWEAWIEFCPGGDGPVHITDRETTQPNRMAVEYWASGLEPVYFEGAFNRATARLRR